MIDTHTHLTSCDEPEAALGRARAAGVSRLITIGSHEQEMRAALALARANADVWTTAGLHPHSAGDWHDGIAYAIAERARDPRVVAIGETGLDWFRNHAPRERQLEAFRGQLAIARTAGLPVVIHCREADAECFPLLESEGPETVVLHCFSTPDRLDEALANGWYCSFAGNVTYPTAKNLQAAAERIPADRILLETDAPYLTPVPFRGEPNEPCRVMDTLRFVAALRAIEPDALAAQVEANAERAFPRLAAA